MEQMNNNRPDMGSQPLVSIIMPIYNTAAYLAESVESILNQTYPVWELFLINDGSTDGSDVVARQFLADPRITYLEHENSRAAFTRNRGFKVCRGEFIAFLDSDDIWHSEKLEKQLRMFAEHPEAGVVYAQRDVVDSEGKPMANGYRPQLHSGFVLNELYVDSFICMSSAMMRRKVVDEVGVFDETCRVSEDWDFWLRVACRFTFQHSDELLVKYRIHGTQVSRSLDVRIKEVWETRERLEKTSGHLISPVARRRAKALHFSHKAYRNEAVAGKAVVLADYLRALRHYPQDRFSWRGVARVLLPDFLAELYRKVRGAES